MHHLDTGSSYRAATLAVLRAGVDPNDAVAAARVVERAEISYSDGVVCLDGRPVRSEIRSAEVTAAVSAVSAIPQVRLLVVEVQRRWVAERGSHAVVEGRDIGTVVFPDAAVKIFMTARPEVRAVRRSQDPEASGQDPAAIAAALAERDEKDSNRQMSPLRPADDAIVVDTSDLDLHEVIATVLDIVDRALQRPDMR
jgi:cytidylate kinase